MKAIDCSIEDLAVNLQNGTTIKNLITYSRMLLLDSIDSNERNRRTSLFFTRPEWITIGCEKGIVGFYSVYSREELHEVQSHGIAM